MKGYALSQNQLARAIGISPNRIAEIVNNRRRITADTALRLAFYFGNSPEFWLNLQTHDDLKMARKELSPRSQRIGPWSVTALSASNRGPRCAPSFDQVQSLRHEYHNISESILWKS